MEHQGTPGCRISGKLLIGGRKTYKEEAAGRDLAAFVDQLPEALRWFFEERFLPTSWYDASCLETIQLEFARWLDEDPGRVARRLGGKTAYENAGSVGRILMSLFGSPQRVAKYLPDYWGRLYDSGVVEADYDRTTGLLSITIREWESHSPLMCLNPLGSIEEMSRRFREPRFIDGRRVACVATGASACRYELRYASL
ncbi:MAG: hypothetical protein AAF799_29830 [Myxococcota bacterium]